MNNRHFTVALAAISVQAISLKETYPIAGGEGTGTPQQELSVELNELAQVNWENPYGDMLSFCADNMLDQLCLALKAEHEKAEVHNWAEDGDNQYSSSAWWKFAQVDAAAEVDAEYFYTFIPHCVKYPNDPGC